MTKDIFPLLLVGVGVIMLIIPFAGSSSPLQDIQKAFTPKNQIVCDVKLEAETFGVAKIRDLNCVRQKSIVCGFQTEGLSDLIIREGTVKLLSDDGRFDTEEFKVNILTENQFFDKTLSVCTESTSGKVQVFERGGDLIDERIFNVA